VALARKRARELASPATHSLQQQALSRIASMAYYDTSCRLEMGSPMVHLYLLQPTAQLPFAYNSHEFTFVLLTQILRLMAEKEWTATFTRRKPGIRGGGQAAGNGIDVFTCVPQIADYLYRDDKEESDVPFLFFEAFQQRVDNSSGKARSNTRERPKRKRGRKQTGVGSFMADEASEGEEEDDDVILLESFERNYKPMHPKAHSHHYRRIDRRKSSTFFAPRIVTLIGPRLPDQRKLSSSNTLRDLYARMALSLFDHYRTFADLLLIDRANPGAKYKDTEEDSAYWLAWCARKDTICASNPVIQAILDQMQDYHDGQRDALNTRSVPDQGNDATGTTSCSRRRTTTATEEECYTDYVEMCLLAAIDDCEPKVSEASDRLFVAHGKKWDDTVAATTERIEMSATQSTVWPMADTFANLPSSIGRYTWPIDPSNTETEAPSPVGGDCIPTRGIQYERLPDNWLEFKRDKFPVQEAGFHPPTMEDAVAGVGSSIAEVSELFGHDEEQWRGYTTPITSLIETHRVKQSNNNPTIAAVLPLPKQLCMQIVGAAGTGKSAIIKAMLYTGTRLGIRNSILTVSPGGGAALSIDGVTLDSFTWPMKGYRPLKKEIAKLREKYAALLMIILDEVSFVKHQDLWLLDARLRQIMGVDLPFGGLHVVLFGDFLQVWVKHSFL
jgi:PIF1-like helicase